MVNSPNVVNKHQNTFIREMLFQTGFVFLLLLPHLTSSPTIVASVTGSFQLWHHCLGHIFGSCMRLLVHCGLLGPVSRDVSLQCQGCRLDKHIQLPYPTSASVSQCPFD
jgi:hypothetical protein